MPSSDRMEVCRKDAKRSTASYYETVLQLAGDCCTEISWDISQTMLDQLWEENSFAAPELLGTSNSVVSAQSKKSIHTSAHHVCQGCGFRLHPGWHGSTLRIRRLSKPSHPLVRTLRRREQRKRRREARAEEMKAKETPSRSRRTPTESTDGQKPTADEKLVVLRNDPSICRLDRNHLVLTCGRCHEKTHLKSLKREPRDSVAVDANFASRTNVVTKQIVASGSLGENYEPLPKHQKTSRPSNFAANGKQSSGSLSLLEQKMGRKKKKKKTTSISSNQKSGNLLNFLSSLNDH